MPNLNSDQKEIPKGPIILLLHIRTRRGRQEELVRFLREAVPFYEQPGGIRIRLLQNLADPDKFIEIAEYENYQAYSEDQNRVRTDATMKTFLSGWHSLIEDSVATDAFLDRTAAIHQGGYDDSLSRV